MKMSIYTAHLRNLFTREEYMTISREHRNKLRYYFRSYYSVDSFRDLFSTIDAYTVIIDLLHDLEASDDEIQAVVTAQKRVQNMIDASQKRLTYRR